MAKLIITAGDGSTSERALTGKAFTIGRAADCDLTIKGDPKVSRSHCKLELRGSDYHLSDLGSANGTRLNGEKIGSQVMRLEDGDRIGVGNAKVEFWVAEPHPREAPAAGGGGAGPGGGAGGVASDLLKRVTGTLQRVFKKKGPDGGGALTADGTITCDCGAVINVADRAPGQKVGCPRCKKLHAVPGK